jgi:AraC family transcriptional regulator
MSSVGEETAAGGLLRAALQGGNPGGRQHLFFRYTRSASEGLSSKATTTLSHDATMIDAGTSLGNAPDALAKILDHAPPVAITTFKNHTRLTRPWGHGALHNYLPGMEGHVIITYYGQPQEILWRTDGKRLLSTTRSGSITIIPQGRDGDWDIAGPIGVSHVFLPDDRLRASAEQLGHGNGVELLSRVGFDDPVASRLMEMLGREADLSDPSARLFLEQATDLLCTQLLRSHSSHAALSAPSTRRGLPTWQVKKVTTYMSERLGAPIGLDDLAAVAGLSRFHFCTAFRQATGSTPHEWLVRLRIERARKLLGDPALSITEIALAVGYETPSSFAAAFRKVTGVTPTHFRHSLRS